MAKKPRRVAARGLPSDAFKEIYRDAAIRAACNSMSSKDPLRALRALAVIAALHGLHGETDEETLTIRLKEAERTD